MEGDALSYDETWDDRKGKSNASNCTGGTGGSGGGFGGGGKGKGNGEGKNSQRNLGVEEEDAVVSTRATTALVEDEAPPFVPLRPTSINTNQRRVHPNDPIYHLNSVEEEGATVPTWATAAVVEDEPPPFVPLRSTSVNTNYY